ncbi:MAG: hypothetical protein JWM76_4114 [Pseudonocardiales bacterium]|nr:hypothetical protein [Pseudonocardiales bacterium]
MTSSRPARLGIITTGGGPRPEYDDFHARLLAGIGFPGVEIVSRHALDGLTEEELVAYEPQPGKPAVHANIKSPGNRTNLGEGWRDVWLDRSLYLDRVQLALDELETEGVDAAIVCIAEELPGHSLQASFPVVIPEIAMAAAAEMIVRTRANTRIALFSYSDKQRDQQRAAWSRFPWMDSVTVSYIGLDAGWEEATRLAKLAQPHLALLWGYGIGLIGGTGTEVAELRAALGVPVLAPHVLAGMTARNFLTPEIEPQDFLGAVVGNGDVAK